MTPEKPQMTPIRLWLQTKESTELWQHFRSSVRYGSVKIIFVLVYYADLLLFTLDYWNCVLLFIIILYCNSVALCFSVSIVDVNSNPSFGITSGTVAPLLLILGYANGIQIWMIPVSVLSQKTLFWQRNIDYW